MIKYMIVFFYGSFILDFLSFALNDSFGIKI